MVISIGGKMSDWFKVAKAVNYGTDDVPDKYGFTEKMHDIWDLVEAEKPLEDCGFVISEADREWYEDYKFVFELKKEISGRKYRFPRYTLDD